MASSDPRFDNNAILDCTVKLCRLSGPRTWTTVPGNSRLLLVKIEKSGEVKCQIIVHNNLGKLVLNAYILEGVALKVQMGKENCFVTKLWPRTEACSRRALYSIRFVGDKAKVNANTFNFVYSIFSGEPEAGNGCDGDDDEVKDDEVDHRKSTVKDNASTESSVDNSSDEESKNLLDASDEEELDGSEGDDKVRAMHGRFSNFKLHDEWDGDVIDESQGF